LDLHGLVLNLGYRLLKKNQTAREARRKKLAWVCFRERSHSGVSLLFLLWFVPRRRSDSCNIREGTISRSKNADIRISGSGTGYIRYPYPDPGSGYGYHRWGEHTPHPKGGAPLILVASGFEMWGYLEMWRHISVFTHAHVFTHKRLMGCWQVNGWNTLPG